MKYLLVFSTVASLKEARKMAGILLEKKLAACITILPQAESHYVWQGKREKSREFLLLIKTKTASYRKLEVAIRQNHSYQTPEILGVPIQKGSRNYFAWMQDSMC